jgi:hypothetical protein
MTTVSVVRWDTERGISYFTVPSNAVTGDVVVYGQVGSVRTDFPDGTFPLQIVPVVSDVQVSSVSSDGSSATVVISGAGLIEGNATEYRFGSGPGSVVVTDLSVNSGPDVSGNNSQVTLTVPLSDGAFGPITVKTAGGTSAVYSIGLTGIESVAFSGAPADATQASANTGQAVTLVGSGLSTATDVLLRYVDDSGNVRMVRLSPVAAALDGTRATLVVPEYANGVFALQVFGTSTQPLLQIVPTLDFYDAIYSGALVGSGLTEAATRYDFAGLSVQDDQAGTGPDVNGSVYVFDPRIETYYYTRGAQLSGSLPHFGLGPVTVTTAGGTSTAVDLDALRPGTESAAVGSLADVAVDPVSGALWTVNTSNPGRIQRIDPSSGLVQQTITLDAAIFGNQYTANYAGLQVLAQAMSLAGVNVPAGSLLLFSGYYYNSPPSVVAINPSSGTVLAQLTPPPFDQWTAGLYDPTSGHLFVLGHSLNQMVEIDPLTSAELGRYSLPVNIQSWAGIAIDPDDGQFWIGSSSSGSSLVQIDRTGQELRRIDLRDQGFGNGSISGLAFAPDGTLRVSDANGLIHRVDLDALSEVATPAPTLTQIIGAALSGTAAQAGVAAANTDQVIELVGSNFGPATQVLFNTRGANGGNDIAAVDIVAVRPLVVNAAGTRLQVQVPDLALTGDVRVSNVGLQQLGFNNGGTSYGDAIHRGLSAGFVAGSAQASIRFADGGLEDLSNESWGIDNVVVRDAVTGDIVFQDDFEGGASGAWSSSLTDRSASGSFSEFSGRFANNSQTLTLAGLTAGRSYTLSFDLYAIDSWDGQNGSPDRIAVTVDDTIVFNRTVSNYVQYAQDVNASAGVRLQIVPTIASLSGRPNQDDNFTINGSGLIEAGTTVTVGGVSWTDRYTSGSPFDVGGSNTSLSAVMPRSLDGPIRVATEGGFFEIAGPAFGVQPLSQFSGITASASSGSAGNPLAPSAVTGQSIVLTGQGFTSSTLVQFQGLDDTGRLGTLTRTGSVGGSGTTLTVEVPALARSGPVTVLGSGTSIDLQIVPVLRGLGGTVASGNTIVLEGTGLTANDLAIAIDGRGVGNFSVRTINDGPGSAYPDQQLLTLVVPAGITSGVITVSTAGGSSTIRAGAVSITALPELTPAEEIGDTLALALAPALGNNQSLRINSSIGGALAGLDVDLVRVELTAGDVLNLLVSGINSSRLRVFDANGVQLTATNFSAAPTTPLRWVAPTGGTYYFGISGSGNTTYNPTIPGSGTASTQGNYALNIERLAAGSSRLASIATAASSGTPAVAGVASANTGQTLTIAGSGFIASDRIVFTMLDDSGRIFESTITPTAVAADGLSLTVVVPQQATTGRVRLDRDPASSGILLQIVPTVSGYTSSGGTSFSLVGTGFAESSTTIVLPTETQEDTLRGHGPDISNSNRNLYVPVSLPESKSTVQVTTLGGTSAPFLTGQP